MNKQIKYARTPEEIMHGLEQKNRLLNQKNAEFEDLAEKKAQTEKDYKMAVREQILRHKTDGHPATLIPKLVEGHKAVADLKFAFDVADAILKANLESCKDIRSQIDTYRSMLSYIKYEATGG